MSSPYKGRRGFDRIRRAVGHSYAGLAAAYRHEAAFRQELLLAALLLPLALLVSESASERALLIGAVLLVLVVELLNSAVEAVVDRISHERHELSKQAKDLGSAAVLVALVNAAFVWGVILWPRLSG
jgi:diacylglycerol kinase (ATP)